MELVMVAPISENIIGFQDETSLFCNFKRPEDGLPKPPTCDKYDAITKNKEGKTARTLSELIEEVTN